MVVTLHGKKMALPDLKQLEIIVKAAAVEELVPTFAKSEYSYKEDGSVVTPADLAIQERLEQELSQLWPQYPVLGEEMEHEQQLEVIENKAGYWCIDPLDGTSIFARGLPFFAVSVALVINNVAELGLIYDPLRDELFTAIKGKGASLNHVPLTGQVDPISRKRVIAEIDFKRLPADLAQRLVVEKPYDSQRNIGSSALDWCWLAAGRYNIYLHGGQKLWDYAAGHLIVHETGGQSIALDGLAVFRGRLETRSVLASLDIELFYKWQQWIGIP